MAKQRTIFFLLVAVLTVFSGCQASYEINSSSAAEILRTLSADDMRGRRATDPAIEKAADFIAQNFEETGLSYFEQLEGYRQEFELHHLTEDESRVILNGRTIPNEQYFALLDEEEFSLDQSSIDIVRIGEEDNFRNHFYQHRSSDKDLLVLVDPAHEKNFSRFRAYFSRYTRKMDLGKGANIVYLLTDENPESVSIEFKNAIKTQKLSNVVGVLEGRRTDEFVLFSAHYDHIGIQQPVEGDSVANGANDNASGVTAVLELARYFKSKGKPERTLIFVAFTAEEMGGYGSVYFSRQLDPDDIVAMFNIEMIGKPAVEGPNTAWITGFERSSFGQLLQKSTEGTPYTFYPDPYPQQNLFYRSDNATLARLGVPAHTISTTPIDVDPDYHEVTDEFETIDIAHLTNTIKAIARAAEGIVSGKDTPTRVNPEELN